MLPIGSTVKGTLDGDTVTWHESISKGVTVSFKVSLIQNGNPSFGGQVLHVDDRLNITFINNPSTDYDEVFSTSIPDYLEVNYAGTVLTTSMLSLLEIQMLYGFIFPIQYKLTNGTDISLDKFLGNFTPSLFNEIGLTASPTHYTTNWLNTTDAYSIETTATIETGISIFVSFTTSTENYFFQYIGSSYPPEEEGEVPTTIKWSEIVKKGTILAWNVTTLNNTGLEPFKIADIVVNEGDIIQLGYVKNLPTKAKDWMDPDSPPDWVQLFINSNEVDLSKMGSEGELFMFMVIPIEASYANGTKVYLDDFFDLFIGDDDDLTNYNRTEISSLYYPYIYYDVKWQETWDDDGETGYANYYLRSTISSGITVKLDINASDGQLTWEFYEEASNVDPDNAVSKTMESEYSIALDYPVLTPGFELITLMIALGVYLWINRRRR